MKKITLTVLISVILAAPSSYAEPHSKASDQFTTASTEVAAAIFVSYLFLNDHYFGTLDRLEQESECLYRNTCRLESELHSLRVRREFANGSDLLPNRDGMHPDELKFRQLQIRLGDSLLKSKALDARMDRFHSHWVEEDAVGQLERPGGLRRLEQLFSIKSPVGLGTKALGGAIGVGLFADAIRRFHDVATGSQPDLAAAVADGSSPGVSSTTLARQQGELNPVVAAPVY